MNGMSRPCESASCYTGRLQKRKSRTFCASEFGGRSPEKSRVWRAGSETGHGHRDTELEKLTEGH